MTRAEILAETVARLEAEALLPPPRYPTVQEARVRHAAGLDDHGDIRRPLPALYADHRTESEEA